MQARNLDLTEQTRSLHDLSLAVHRKVWADEARALRIENENLRQRIRTLEAEVAERGKAKAQPMGCEEEVSTMLHGSNEEVVVGRSARPDACCRSTTTCDELHPDEALGLDRSTPGPEALRSDSILSISPCSSVSRDSHVSHVSKTGEASTRNSGTLSLSLRQRLADAEQAHRRLQRENHLNQVLSEKDVQIRHLKGKCASCGLSCFSESGTLSKAAVAV